MLQVGIVGQPGCGKTSLFKALAPASTAEVGVGGKREIHIGQAKVADPRLDSLDRIFQKGRKVSAMVEYVDVVGFSSGDAARSGYEAQFLGEIRTCDALLHVLRNFDFPGLTPAHPVRDYRADFQEFILSDQIILEKRLERLRREVLKNRTPEVMAELELMERCLQVLSDESPLRILQFSESDKQFLKTYQPLTAKPELAVINVSEDDVGRAEEIVARLRPAIEGPGVKVTAACASIEMEIAELDTESAREFMDDLGIKAAALDRIIAASFRLLGLISFFTVGEQEVRAWTIPRGMPARKAAGVVHTDMERGFIRAEVVNFGDFESRGSFAACRSDGVLRLEGKDYVVQDGDIIQFRFAV